MKTMTIIITSITLTIAIVAALTINAIAQTTNNGTSNIGKNGVLIKIHADNMTSWSAIIVTGPGGILNGSYTNLSGIGDRNFLLSCPYGRYDVEIGIDAVNS
ncbi:MAG: hypothetical protein WBF33_31280 [Candidatus Nitrosopolaris sp.]|jgi:hypothetical protein